MSLPKRIDELDSASTVSAGAYIAVVNAGLTQRATLSQIGASSSSFTATANPTTNTALLTAALAAGDDIVVPAGTYDNITISSSDKTLRMQRGVTFKIPNGTVLAGATSGPAVFGVSGSNITIYGDFSIDGNSANNNASSFPTSNQEGNVWIHGSNCRIYGTVTVTDAYWRGFTVQNGDSSGNEVDTFFCDCIKVSNPFSYAVMFWTVKNFHVNRIEVVRSTCLDARTRIGSQGASTGQARDGYIGSIKSDSSVVFEANAYKVEIGSINCAVFKFQDASDCHVEKITSDYTIGYTQDQVDAIGIAFISALRCSIGTARVTRYNCSLESAFAVGGGGVITATQDCSVGALYVDGTLHAVSDCRIITTDGFDFGSINLKSSIAVGFLFDTDSASSALLPQRRITIGSLVSTGHTTDVTLESAGAARSEQIKIDYINPDAIIATGGGDHPFGTFAMLISASAVSVTNGFVTSSSIIHVDPIDAAAGVVIQTKGYFITKANNGTFVMHTGDGTGTAATSNWTYHVVTQFTPTA